MSYGKIKRYYNLVRMDVTCVYLKGKKYAEALQSNK